MPKSLEQILGGYATDTLTEEEKRQLFEAALHDQMLFNALADEEGLKALLADPQARQRILDSLETGEYPQEFDLSDSPKLSWFKKQSSLAWAGSIAAMGLALIFGWQLEKEWWPKVQQELDAERSVTEEHQSNENPLRSQAPIAAKLKEQVQAREKKDQQQSDRIAGLSVPVSPPQASRIQKPSKSSEPMRQRSARVRSEDIVRNKVKEKHQLRAKNLMPQLPESIIVQNIPEEERMVASSMASPTEDEKGLPQLAWPPSFADTLEERDALSSTGAREGLNAKKRRRVDAVQEKLGDSRAQQILGRATYQDEKMLAEEVADLEDSATVAQMYAQGQTRGIRYRFIHKLADGEEKAIDIKNYSGKWSELHLEIESNVSGHLYAALSIGKGKWQLMAPESLNNSGAFEGAILMEAYQSVNLALSQVASDRLARPVASSITLLLSSTQFKDIAQWLGQGIGHEPFERNSIEKVTIENFILDPSPETGVPLKGKILLKKANNPKKVSESLPHE